MQKFIDGYIRRIEKEIDRFARSNLKGFLDYEIERMTALREEKKFQIQSIFFGNTAYLCKPLSKEDGCGWVIGLPRKEYYMSSPENWRARKGREGYIYYCNVCNGYLDERWIRVSEK